MKLVIQTVVPVSFGVGISMVYLLIILPSLQRKVTTHQRPNFLQLIATPQPALYYRVSLPTDTA